MFYECRKSALVNVNIRFSVQQKLYCGGMPIPEVVISVPRYGHTSKVKFLLDLGAEICYNARVRRDGE